MSLPLRLGRSSPDRRSGTSVLVAEDSRPSQLAERLRRCCGTEEYETLVIVGDGQQLAAQRQGADFGKEESVVLTISDRHVVAIT